MSGILRLMLLAAAVLAAVWIFRRIRKCKVKQQDAAYWICFAILLAVLGIFPKISYFFAESLGIISPVNFVYLVIIFLLIEKLLSVSIQVSMLESKVEILSAELAIRSKDQQEKTEQTKTKQKKEDEKC